MSIIDLFRRRDKLQQEIRLGSEARGLIEHPLIKAFFEKYEKDCYERWRNSPPGEEGRETRDEAYRMVGVADSFRMRLNSFISTAESSKPILVDVEQQITELEK